MMHSTIIFLMIQVLAIDAFVYRSSLHSYNHKSSSGETFLPKSRHRLSTIAKIETPQNAGTRTTLQSTEQSHFDIPTLEDDVKCGGRDMITHIRHLHKSAFDLTGSGVFERMGVNVTLESSERELYEAICKNERYVLISHGKQDDPIYNFGNYACLQAFARSWDDLTSMPSRLCVVSKSEDEALRIKLMHNVTNYGYVDGEYRGYRVRGDGAFIKLVECCVWNCYDDGGEYIGQAALFDRQVSPIVASTE